MPDTPHPDRSCRTTTPRPRPVPEVVDLLTTYAAADRALSHALDRIGAETCASRRVSQSTVSRLMSLIEQSLLPGVRAREELGALPRPLLRAAIAAWAAREGAARIPATRGIA